jgi:hypothetical protein
VQFLFLARIVAVTAPNHFCLLPAYPLRALHLPDVQEWTNISKRRLHTASDYTLDISSIAKDCAHYSRAQSSSLTVNGIPSDRTAFPATIVASSGFKRGSCRCSVSTSAAISQCNLTYRLSILKLPDSCLLTPFKIPRGVSIYLQHVLFSFPAVSVIYPGLAQSSQLSRTQLRLLRSV